MTCIAGICQDRKVWIGADTASAAGWRVRSTWLSKVFQVGEYLIGYTSSFRMGQILQYHLEVKPQADADGQHDDLRHLVADFVPSARDCLEQHWYSEIKTKQEPGGTFLLGYRGRLYRVDSDFQIVPSRDNFDACGCGEDYALATLKTMHDLLPNIRPPEQIYMALKTAEHFSGGVKGPFDVLSV